jgi:2,4-dienoyl-CoA reductase-like NADH-dependent reductase (Old Yellow Enzyme family)/thioredoxin reductase
MVNQKYPEFNLNLASIDNFPFLFQPGKIGPLHLKNRIIMAAMGNALSDDKGNVTDAMIEYYRARARGGVSMVITQFASISEDALMPYNLSIYDDKFIEGFKKLVRAIHEQGAKVCLQLMHPGMLFLLLKAIPAGISIRVPSLTPRMSKDKPFQTLDIDDIERYISKFVSASERVREAGADAVEIHACHGCLLTSFLSPALNQRTDRYGGDVNNRTRFVRQVVERIRERLGPEFPLLVRINGCDDIEGGVTPGDVVREAAILSSAGASAISISSGIEFWSTLMAPSYLTPEGVIIPVAEQVKKAVRIPVIASGKISPLLAEKILSEAKIDFVAMGRPLLAEPEFPDKLSHKGLSGVSSCLYCNNCLRTSWNSCTVNPFLYRESTSALHPATTPKKIMVIGGGLAGLQAAVILKRRGHQVTLYEKEAELGGQWRIASALPGKTGYFSAINFLKNTLDSLQVPIMLNRCISKELVKEIHPDIAIIATGAIPAKLEIPGARSANIIQANDLIIHKTEANGKIVVIGGSMVGLEVAVWLAEEGKEVTLVSHSALGGRKGPDDMITFRGLLRRIAQLRVPLYLNVNILEISGNNLMISLGEEVLPIPADTIVLAVGAKADDSLAGELKGIVPEIYLIGDCIMPGNGGQATYSAARLALKL